MLASGPWTRDGMRVLNAQGQLVLLGIMTRDRGEVQAATALPDLLEACKEALHCLAAQVGEDISNPREADKALATLETAIAKAEGA